MSEFGLDFDGRFYFQWKNKEKYCFRLFYSPMEKHICLTRLIEKKEFGNKIYVSEKRKDGNYFAVFEIGKEYAYMVSMVNMKKEFHIIRIVNISESKCLCEQCLSTLINFQL